MKVSYFFAPRLSFTPLITAIQPGTQVPFPDVFHFGKLQRSNNYNHANRK